MKLTLSPIRESWLLRIGRCWAPVLKEFVLLGIVGFVVFLVLGVFGVVRRNPDDVLITCVIFLPIGVMACREWWNRYGRGGHD